MGWAYGFASNIGAVHGNEAMGQDYCLCWTASMKGGKQALVAVVSDGAGSTSLGGVGARIACETFIAAASEALFERKEQDVSDSELCQIFDRIVKAILDKAEADGKPKDEYSCTLVAAVIFEKLGLFFQVGDGAAAFRTDLDFEVAIWPEKSEFVNTTFFLTREDARDHLLIRRIPLSIGEVALFTDGLQYMLLDFKENRPHQPFFQSVSGKLNGASSGESPQFSTWLKKVLESPQVTERSDDDTSIVFAKRAAK